MRGQSSLKSGLATDCSNPPSYHCCFVAAFCSTRSILLPHCCSTLKSKLRKQIFASKICLNENQSQHNTLLNCSLKPKYIVVCFCLLLFQFACYMLELLNCPICERNFTRKAVNFNANVSFGNNVQWQFQENVLALDRNCQFSKKMNHIHK